MWINYIIYTIFIIPITGISYGMLPWTIGFSIVFPYCFAVKVLNLPDIFGFISIGIQILLLPIAIFMNK